MSLKLDTSYLNEHSLRIIKHYNLARTLMGSGRFASYKDYGESIWRIGYGSMEMHGKVVTPKTRATQKEIDEQLKIDLEVLSHKLSKIIYWPLNPKKKAAVISYAFSNGFIPFKNSQLFELINSGCHKKKLIKEWSPFINKAWLNKSDFIIDQRRSELNLFLAADKEVPTFLPHKCKSKYCLLNIHETYNGNVNQIKGINYLEKKIQELDPSGDVLRRFFRYWNQEPGGLGSPKNK